MVEGGLTVIVPTKTEKFLFQTTLEVINKAKGDVECIVVLDGYTLPEEEIIKDPRVRYIHREYTDQLTKRQCINEAVEVAKYEHIMALDAHCMLGEGYDEILKRDCQENWVVIPRRERLDAEGWKIYRGDNNELNPIDYEYYMWQWVKKGIQGDRSGGLHGWKWDERTIARKDIMIDDTLAFQGSCWFLHKAWFKKIGLMQIEGYTGWGQESEEITLKTRLNGGKVMTDKNTWYAHLYKGKKYGRMFSVPPGGIHAADLYHFNKFVNENRGLFVELINSFMPMPGYPSDWETYLPKL